MNLIAIRNNKSFCRWCKRNNQDYDKFVGNKCQYCNIDTIEVDSMFIYGKVYTETPFKFCTNCSSYVGCHPHTNIGLGVTSNFELRQLKKQAHKYFDNIWRKAMKVKKISKRKARGETYRWISKELEIPIQLTHIGMFDKNQLIRVVELSKPFFNSKYQNK